MGAHVNLVRCVLFLSSAPLFTQAKVEFFDSENYELSLYTAERITTSCETLPRSLQNTANSIKTDSCIILYSNEFCVGSFFKVEAGEHPSLPYFKSQVESFRACTDVSKDEPWRDVRIKLYLHDGSNEMLWDKPITPECVTLPLLIRDKASAVNTDLCVILFTGPNCIGGQYKVESTGYDKDILDFNDVTQSFMPCNTSDVYKSEFHPIAEPEGNASNKSESTQVHLPSRAEFFHYINLDSSKYAVEMVTTTCVNLPPDMRKKSFSINTEGCIILYSGGNCKGGYLVLEAGDRIILRLHYFDDKAVSYRACRDVRKDQKIQPLSPDGPRIQFFDHYNYNDMIWDTPINPNCTTLPEPIRNRTSSLKSDLCVVLFSGTNCVGSEFLVKDFLWDNSLEYFQDKLVSFMPCNVGDVLNNSVVVITTTKPPFAEFSTTIRHNSVRKPQELSISHQIENPVSERSLEIQHHSEKSLVLLGAIGLVVAIRFLMVLLLFLLLVWICFMHSGKLLRFLKRASHKNNSKAENEMGEIQLF